MLSLAQKLEPPFVRSVPPRPLRSARKAWLGKRCPRCGLWECFCESTTHAVAAFDESLSSVGAADKAASYQRGFLDTLPAGDPLVRRPWSAGSRCTLDGSTPSPWAAPLFTRPLAFATRRKSGAPMSEVEGGM